MDKDILLQRYEKGLASSGKIRGLYLRYAREFLDFSDGKFDHETILKYLDYLKRKHKYSDGTVNFVFRLIHTLYNRNSAYLIREGTKWPFGRGETPRIRQNKVVALELDRDVVIEMIEMVKAKGEADEKAFLALSTTYGLRRQEMTGLRAEDLDMDNRTIQIATGKQREQRTTHTISSDIVPALSEYHFSTSISEFRLISVWYRIEWRIGLPHVDQVGWLSIRRTLYTLLRDQVPGYVLDSFMRWKRQRPFQASLSNSAQRVVGRGAISPARINGPRDIDERVFSVHPFLKYWK